MEEAELTYRRTGDALVFFPLLYTLTVVFYFTFLSGSVKLSDVFPWFFYLYFPAVAVSIFFTVRTLIHLFSRNGSVPPCMKALWVVLLLLANPIALPVYRLHRMG